jgi:hypothetical protein
MRKLYIPASFQDEAARCPTCQKLGELDEALLTLQERSNEYAQLLRNCIIALAFDGHAELARQASSVHGRLDTFLSSWRDTVEVDRGGYGYNLFLYFTAEEFDGLNNRLRKGVQAHEQCVSEAKALLQKSGQIFVELNTAHGLLLAAYLDVVPKGKLLEALESRFQSIVQAQAIVWQLANGFWQQMEPWMLARRKAAFTVL